jgi:hypothetical protein
MPTIGAHPSKVDRMSLITPSRLCPTAPNCTRTNHKRTPLASIELAATRMAHARDCWVALKRLTQPTSAARAAPSPFVTLASDPPTNPDHPHHLPIWACQVAARRPSVMGCRQSAHRPPGLVARRLCGWAVLARPETGCPIHTPEPSVSTDTNPESLSWPS